MTNISSFSEIKAEALLQRANDASVVTTTCANARFAEEKHTPLFMQHEASAAPLVSRSNMRTS